MDISHIISILYRLNEDIIVLSVVEYKANGIVADKNDIFVLLIFCICSSVHFYLERMLLVAFIDFDQENPD